MVRIGEFSKMSKTTIKALRYYEKEGLSIKDIKKVLDGYDIIKILHNKKKEIENNLDIYNA